jgi:hypothetical protein
MSWYLRIAVLFLLFAGQVALADIKLGTTSQIQIVYQPSDIFSSGCDEDAKTTFAIRALADNLSGPRIVAGSLKDEDSSETLPPEAFDLVKRDASPSDPISTANLTELTISVKKDWVRAGKYSGTLWIAATGDSGAQSINLKVCIRPRSAWLIGSLTIAGGAAISWFAIFWVGRQRQLGANQVLIARLQTLTQSLLETLQAMTSSGAPAATGTVQHLRQILRDRLPELMHDKELSIIAGVTVPPIGVVSVVDEVDGTNRIVRNGFEELLRIWNDPGSNHAALIPLFADMDALGSVAQPLSAIDTKIQAILAKAPAPGARIHANGQLPALPSEESIVHRLVATTYVLDFVSLLTILAAGMLLVIWKNPGFGTMGNYIEAFLWGLGLKLGSDLTKLGPADIRTSFGIKTPTP